MDHNLHVLNLCKSRLMNLCKSRLLEAAAEEQRACVRQAAATSRSGNHLFRADRRLLGSPLLRKGVDASAVTRREEIIFSHMRLGCVAFSSGFRWRAGESPACALCGGPDSPGHALFRCRVLVEERSALFERVMAERAERSVERALDLGAPLSPAGTFHTRTWRRW